MLIEHLDFVATVDGENKVIRDGALLLAGDRFAAVGATEDVQARIESGPVSVIDGRGFGATPGFIDAHVHLSETLSRALFPDQLATRPWVFHWAKPFYGHVTEEDERVSALVATAEMLRAGTTCFLDMGAQNNPGVVVSAVAQTGIRGITGRHAADCRPREIPPGWSPEMIAHHFFPDADAALEALEEAIHDWHGALDGRVRCWANIEGKEPCSLELHVGARELADRLGVGTTYHIASSIEEARISEERYGSWPITRMADAGGLGRNVVLAHAVAVRDEEIDLLRESGTKIAFCPGTSLKLAKGATSIGRYPEMLEANVRIGLGTDGVSASGNLNLMRQMYLAAGIFKDARRDPYLVGAESAVRLATIEGATLLKWEDEIGSLELGKKADFVLFDLNHPEWLPYDDPIQALVWSVTSASIAETWVNGVPTFRDGHVLGIDESELSAEARARGRAVAQRAGLDHRSTPLTTSLYG